MHWLVVAAATWGANAALAVLTTGLHQVLHGYGLNPHSRASFSFRLCPPLWCPRTRPRVCVGVTPSPGSLLLFSLYRAVKSDPGFVSRPHGAQGEPGQAEYCDKCSHRRPDRAHHCKICKRCVKKMDHVRCSLPVPHAVSMNSVLPGGGGGHLTGASSSPSLPGPLLAATARAQIACQLT